MGSLDYLDFYGGVAGDAWDAVKGVATKAGYGADTPAPASVAATPAGVTADPNTWPDDWWPNPSNAETWPDDWWPQAPAPAPGGFGPGATGPLSGFAPPSGGYGYGPGAGGALSGFDPTGGRSGPTQDELAAMMAGLQAEQEYSWYNPMGWIDAIPGVQNEPGEEDWFGDFFGEGGTARNILSGVEDGARWLADPSYQAIQELLQGDLSGAIGDFAGGTANQLAPAAGYLAQEGLDVLGNLGDNIYNNWGLRSGLNQLGADITGIPGQVGNLSMDALRYLGDQAGNLGQAALGQAGEWGQAGLGQLGDLQDYLRAQGENVAKWGGNQLLNLGSEVGDLFTEQVLPWAQQQVYDPAMGYLQEDFLEDITNLGQGAWGQLDALGNQVVDFTTDQAIPYFQQDFVGDVQNLYGDVKDWAVDDAWGEAIQPFYENVLKPAGLDVADWAVDDVYKDIITPLYENYLKPAGLEIADFTSQEAWPYIRDNLRHDISNVLEAVPAFVRNVAPEGSRVDNWLEAGVGGAGAAMDWAQGVPGQVGEFGGRVTDYLFDPSKPAWSQGGDGGGTDAAVAQAVADMTQGGGAPGAPGGALGGGGVTYPGGVGATSAPASAQNVADQIYASSQGGAGGGLADLYSQMFDSQRTWAQDAYGAEMRGAEAASQASQDYAASILQQGQQAAAQAEAAASQYYVEGANAAATAYNETVGALNSREQGLIQKHSELAAMEAAGIGDTSAEQRRIGSELEALQTQRTSLRHSLVMAGLTGEETRQTARLDEFKTTGESRLAADEAALIEMITGLEGGRVGQEQAMAEQVANRFAGARSGMQGRLEAAEAALRAQGIEPAAYTSGPGAETQALLTSQELSMETLQNRLRDASAAQAIDRQMRGSEIYSVAGRALEDNLFSMRSQLEESIAQRKSTADLDTFDRQADIDITGAAERGEINLQELAALQASKETMFGRKTDLFAESELNRIYTRTDYNAALQAERAARQRAMERAQEQRIIAQAAASQQAFTGEQNRLQREHEAAMRLKGTSGDIAGSELSTEISRAEGAASEAQRMSEDYIMVNVDGVDVPVDRDWYIEEHLIGPGASGGGSDVNLVEMVDNAGNSFYVDVGGVDEFGTPYLTSSAATNPLITGDILTPAWAE